MKRLLYQIEFKALAEKTSSNQNESGMSEQFMMVVHLSPPPTLSLPSLRYSSLSLLSLSYSPEDTVQLQHERMEV